MDLKKPKIKDKKNQFKLLPYPQPQQSKPIQVLNEKFINDKNHGNNTKKSPTQKQHIIKSPRDLLFMVGKIEFCLNINKLHPNNNILFGIYANILKVTKGKYKLQHIILLRNEFGPVIQVIFYRMLPSSCTVGQNVYCVGRFLGQSNQMHIYKINNIMEIPKNAVFNRIRNVSNFCLKKGKQ